MNPQLILNIVGGITASLILVVGGIILAGYIMPSYVPENYRTVLGIVMIIYGSYRLVMIWIKHRNSKRNEI
jgi:hypothetical protein